MINCTNVFAYDSIYNRTYWNDSHVGSLTYEDNNLNQYTRVGSDWYILYDDRGNYSYSAGENYVYDCENHLVEADYLIDYGYDLLGRRVHRHTPDNMDRTYVWDGAQIITEYINYQAVGYSAKIKYIYGPGIDRPVAMIFDEGSGAEWSYYYPDALGSTRLMTDSSGNVVESYTYDPYGRPRVMRAAGADGNWLTEDVTTYGYSNNPYLFTGRRWDEFTGLYYYRMRDYSPDLGRFLQTDPAGYIDGMNLYAYCGNNPINCIDPYGLFRFGRRDMDGAPFFYRYITPLGMYTGWFNIGLYHEAGFYEDGSGDSATYGPHVVEDPDDYYNISPWQYDDDIMRQAQENVDKSGKFDYEDFGIFHNCQDYCDALREEYKRLGGKVKYKPFNRRDNLGKCKNTEGTP